MANQFTHRCPNCGRFHPCNGRGMSHEIYCPINGRNYTILTGRMGRQVSSVLQVPYGSLACKSLNETRARKEGRLMTGTITRDNYEEGRKQK